MKKLVLKTVGITVAAIIIACVAAYLVLTLCFPRKTAELYSGMGNDKKAVIYYDKAYKKSGDIKDLDSLCMSAIKTGDNGLIAKHLAVLFDGNGFSEYTKTLEGGKSYYNFMAGKYVCALYAVSTDKISVIQNAFSLTDDYVENSAAYTLLRFAVSSDRNDTAFINEFINTLEAQSSKYSDAAKAIAQKDIDSVSSLIA